MVTENSSPIIWANEQEQLIRALQILAEIKPKQKIRILNQEKFQIAIEDRYWFNRKRSGDGCLPTIEIICQIMEECLSLSALI